MQSIILIGNLVPFFGIVCAQVLEFAATSIKETREFFYFVHTAEDFESISRNQKMNHQHI